MKGKPLSETHPELAAQAVGWDPALVTAGMGRKLLWRCELGHEWTAVVKSRVGGNGCPYCSGRYPITGFNDLATTHPSLAAEIAEGDATTVSSGSDKKLLWRCEQGHEWNATVSSRVGGNGCPYCSGFYTAAGFNDLATTHPELAAQADGWDPTKVSAGSPKIMKWQCELSHTFTARIAHRSQGSNCTYCTGRKVLPGFNDLATTNPELAAQADGWDPRQFSANTHSKKKWRCEEGHSWIATVKSRNEGNDCPTCSGHKVLEGFNDLATTHPNLAAQAVGWDTTKVSAGSGKIVKWHCTRGHEWTTRVASRLSGTDCPFCSGHKVLEGFNDLATTHPNLAAQAVGWDTTKVSAGSEQKKSWKCELGHTWKTSVGSRSSGRGCPTCAISGYDPNENGWLYFLEHDLWGLLQIGISNFPDNRLATHNASGWSVTELRGPMPGDVTRQWEQDILHALKRRGVKLAPEQIAGKFSGYTEAWIKEDFPAKSLTELMQLVHNDEETPK